MTAKSPVAAADIIADMRADLRAANEAAWDWISRPGTWLTGAERVAVAREVRNAAACLLCRRRADALSPAAVAGRHDKVGALTDLETEIVHRIVLDQARLTEKWLREALAGGLEEGAYVEIVAIVSMVMMLDRFCWAAGLPVADLPDPVDGPPSRYRPPGTKKSIAWVATVAPEDVVPGDGELYPYSKANVIRALSQVPEAKRAFWALGDSYYVPADQFREMATDARAISRPQIELLASTVSALHDCYY